MKTRQATITSSGVVYTYTVGWKALVSRIANALIVLFGLEIMAFDMRVEKTYKECTLSDEEEFIYQPMK